MSVFNSLMNWAGRLSSNQWMYILIGVTIVGAICLKGFGSRKNY